MTREIKFRASVTDNKGNFLRWAYGTPEFGDMGQLYIHEGIGSQTLTQRNTLGQYTGLHDKNGKEIYEGDVVRWGDLVLEVVFDEGSFHLTYQPAEQNIYSTDWEVIGNIHANPELLK